MANEAVSDSGRSRTAGRLIALPSSSARMTIDKMHLLLAERRSAFSALRTGALLLALPVTVLTLLLMASHDRLEGNLLLYAAPLLAVCAGLLVAGIGLMLHAAAQLRRIGHCIATIRQASGALADAIVS